LQVPLVVRETPAIPGEVNAEAMLRDILDELRTKGPARWYKKTLRRS
jgi:hypothetical protein